MNSNTSANSPLIMWQPMNLTVLLTIYSPLILALGVLSMSFIFQNFKGLIYLGFFFGSCILREFLLMLSGAQSFTMNTFNPICSSVQYSKYGNTGFSVFANTFTIFYLCLPMFLNKDINFPVLGGLLTYYFIDVSIRYAKGCINSSTDIFINTLSGAFLGVIVPGLLYVGGSSKYLFFNEISSGKDVCSMPKKQQFKCAVYKNGQIIGSTMKK